MHGAAKENRDSIRSDARLVEMLVEPAAASALLAAENGWVNLFQHPFDAHLHRPLSDTEHRNQFF
jgi:hypothetical protein